MSLLRWLYRIFCSHLAPMCLRTLSLRFGTYESLRYLPSLQALSFLCWNSTRGNFDALHGSVPQASQRVFSDCHMSAWARRSIQPNFWYFRAGTEMDTCVSSRLFSNGHPTRAKNAGFFACQFFDVLRISRSQSITVTLEWWHKGRKDKASWPWQWVTLYNRQCTELTKKVCKSC